VPAADRVQVHAEREAEGRTWSARKRANTIIMAPCFDLEFSQNPFGLSPRLQSALSDVGIANCSTLLQSPHFLQGFGDGSPKSSCLCSVENTALRLQLLLRTALPRSREAPVAHGTLLQSICPASCSACPPHENRNPLGDRTTTSRRMSSALPIEILRGSSATRSPSSAVPQANLSSPPPTMLNPEYEDPNVVGTDAFIAVVSTSVGLLMICTLALAFMCWRNRRLRRALNTSFSRTVERSHADHSALCSALIDPPLCDWELGVGRRYAIFLSHYKARHRLHCLLKQLGKFSTAHLVKHMPPLAVLCIVAASRAHFLTTQ